jgi:enoyl-CoA hydratase
MAPGSRVHPVRKVKNKGKDQVLMENTSVITRQEGRMLSIILNRTGVINSLDVEMIRLVQKALDEAEASSGIRLVLLKGNGDRGFCAGGDVKKIFGAVKRGNPDRAMEFFKEEYELDLRIFRFPKPVIVLADGITMGGGLGLSAGADMVVTTEKTVMAMPETRIGFFPDVGATGWMFNKCPAGYPEFLGLTGYRLEGGECRRLGLSSHLIPRNMLPEFVKDLEVLSEDISTDKSVAVPELYSAFSSLNGKKGLSNPDMDEWVGTCFSGKTSVKKIVSAVSADSRHKKLSEETLKRLSENSPTALVMTLDLLRHNEKRAMEDVYQADLEAARFIIGHPDYLEGIRAQLVDRDNKPVWQPDSIEKVRLSPININNFNI